MRERGSDLGGRDGGVAVQFEEPVNEFAGRWGRGGVRWATCAVLIMMFTFSPAIA